MGEIKKGYQQTEVGVIPEDWQVRILGQIGDFKNGINKAKDDFGFGFPFVNLMDVFGIPYINSQKSLDLINSNKEERNLYNLECGDVIFVRSSVKPSGVGLTSVVRESLINTVFSGFLIRYRVRIEMDDEFKIHCFHEKGFRDRLIANSSSSANTNISQEALKQLKIPLPPTLTEQKAIATALSDVDNLISNLEKLIAKKKAMKQGAMQQLLTGKKRLPGFSGEWEESSIESLTPSNKKYGIVDGPFGSNLKTEHYRKKGIPIITSGFVTEGYFKAENYLYVDEDKFKQEKRSAVQGGDIVMAKIGARCGASAILPLKHEEGILSGNALKIKIDEKNNSTQLIWQILWNIYKSGDLENITTTGAQPAISMANLKILKIILPPTIEEQKAIATILSDMDNEIEALENKKAKYQKIKQGMMQELLTGKTRLV